MIVLVVDESNLVASLRGVLALWELGEQLLEYMDGLIAIVELNVCTSLFIECIVNIV